MIGFIVLVVVVLALVVGGKRGRVAKRVAVLPPAPSRVGGERREGPGRRSRSHGGM